MDVNSEDKMIVVGMMAVNLAILLNIHNYKVYTLLYFSTQVTLLISLPLLAGSLLCITSSITINPNGQGDTGWRTSVIILSLIISLISISCFTFLIGNIQGVIFLISAALSLWVWGQHRAKLKKIKPVKYSY